MHSDGQTVRPSSRDYLATKLRGVRLKIKKLCIEKGLTREALEDDSSGLNLLIEENDLEQQMQDLDAKVCRLSQDPDPAIAGRGPNDGHASSVSEQQSASAIRAVTSSASFPQTITTGNTHPELVVRDSRSVCDQIYRQPQTENLQTPDSISNTHGDHIYSPVVNHSGNTSFLVIPETLPPVLGVQDQYCPRSLDDTQTTEASTFLPPDLPKELPNTSATVQVVAYGTSSGSHQGNWPLRYVSSGTNNADNMRDDVTYMAGSKSLSTESAFQQSGLPDSVQSTSLPKAPRSCANKSKKRAPSPPRPTTKQARNLMPRPQNDATLTGVMVSPQSIPQRKVQKHRKRSFKTSMEREETAQRRARGACERCHKDKGRCGINPLNPQGPCLRCINVRTDCILWKIACISLFRDQAAPWPTWTKRYSCLERAHDIVGWADNQTKSLHLSHRNPATGRTVNSGYTIQVRRFIPEPGDKLYQDWYDTSTGQHKSHPIQPYAVISLQELTNELNRYIDTSIVSFLVEIVGSEDTTIWQTYVMAFKRCGDSRVPVREQNLIRKALRLWVTARIASLPEDVQGEDKIADKITDPSSPYYDTYPVAPVIYAQEETVVLSKIQRPLQKEVLAELDLMMKEGKKETWLTLYLCLFILAHSCTLTCGRDADYATEVRLQTKFANPEAINANQNGIHTLVSQFRYDNKGFVPFEMALNPLLERELLESTKLDGDQFKLVKDTSEMARSRVRDFEAIRSSADSLNHYYFISQLFSPYDA